MGRFDKDGRLVIPEPEPSKPISRPRKVLAGDKGILLTQLYCANGHPLISPENPTFDGKYSIKLLCEGNQFRQLVFLSPYQGDTRKTFERDFEPGEILSIRCATCEAEFPKLAPHDCQPEAMYITLFLYQDADVNNAACVCNAWNCYASFMRLSGGIISEAQAQVMPEVK